MELTLAAFLGIWIAIGGALCYKNIKNEYSQHTDKDDKENKE